MTPPTGNSRARWPWACAAIVALSPVLPACTDKTVAIDVKVVRRACGSLDPMQEVTHFRTRVVGDDMQPLEAVVETTKGEVAIPDIPWGTNRQIEIAAFASAPPGGALVSVGRTVPFDIPERKDSDAQNVKATVFLRRVDAFTPACRADAPDSSTRLTEPRAGHAATLLADGRVLITGGFSATQADEAGWVMSQTAEIFDPNTGDFQRAAPMNNSGAPTPRAFHGAVRLPSGEVFVAGGEEVRSGTVRILVTGIAYNAEKDLWFPSRGLNAPSPGTGRTRHCSVLDGDGTARTAVVTFGGQTMDASTGRPFLNSDIEWYDLQADKSYVAPSPTTLARLGQACVPMFFSQGTVTAVIGGKYEEPCPTALQCLTGTACASGSQCTGQYLCPAFGKCVNGTPCAVGTQCSDQYSCARRCANDGSTCSATVGCANYASSVAFIKYDERATPPSYRPVAAGADISITPQRSGAVCARVFSNTRFMCCGGMDPKGAYLKDCLVVRVDGSTMSRQAPPLSVERADACAVTLTDGRVFVVGGHYSAGGSERSVANAEVYRTGSDMTTTSSNPGPLTDARYYHSCTLLKDGAVLVLGGLKRDGQTVTTLDTAEIFMPKPLD